MNDILKQSATSLLDLMDKGKISSEDIVTECISTVEKDALGEKPLNAYIELFDDTIKMARDADSRRRSGERQPLLGLPFAVKDNIAIKGRSLTCGSFILDDYESPYSATVIKKLIAAGAIPLGRTNMDEFAMGSSCEYSRYGATRNPFDRDRTPGGSSGGSAAALAGEMATFALGSETGGSVRLPASFCGLFGLKPTYGRLSRYGLVAFSSSMDQIGIFGKTAEDTALILSVAAGKDNNDETSSDAPVPASKPEKVDVSKLRIAVLDEFSGEGTDPDVSAVFRKTVSIFTESGARVENVSLPILKTCIPMYYIIAPAEASSNLARFDGIRYGARKDDGSGLSSLYLNTREQGFGPEVKRRIVVGNFVLSSGYVDAYYKKAQEVRRALVNQIGELFKNYDILLSPTSPTPAFHIGEKVDDPMTMYLSDMFTVFANLSCIPALSVPAGKSATGLPVGIQLAGRAFSESMLLGTAAALRERGLS